MTTDTFQSTNPYILSLAIANTACFGSHDAADSICESCPIKVSCIRQQAVVYAKLAMAMDAADLAEKQAKLTPKTDTLHPITKKSVTSDTSVDDLLADLDKPKTPPMTPKAAAVAVSPVPTPMDDLFSGLAPATPAPVAAKPPVAGPGITCPDNLPCQVCKKQMNKGEKVSFLAGKGLKHLTC